MLSLAKSGHFEFKILKYIRTINSLNKMRITGFIQREKETERERKKGGREEEGKKEGREGEWKEEGKDDRLFFVTEIIRNNKYIMMKSVPNL